MLVGMNAYSLDLRQKILRAYDQRLGSQRALAALFGVSQAFVEKLLRRRRTTGDIAPRPHAGGRRAICNEAALAVVRRLVQAQPDATLAEFCEQLFAQRGLCVSVPTMGRRVITLRVPRNKRRSTPANRTPRASSRPGRPIERRPRRSPPSAARSSLHRASPSPCPGCMAGRPEGSGSAAPFPDDHGGCGS
jgi:transposase